MRPTNSTRFLLVAFGLVLAVVPVGAQIQPPITGWDITQPRGRTREIDFTTSEGTWTAVDVSPDGTWIAFDLLGHIHRMPITGGTAECLTQASGIAINAQPRISPDGKNIAFISDRKGQMNVWIMDNDGKNAVPVLLDAKYEYRWPGWSVNTDYVYVMDFDGDKIRHMTKVWHAGLAMKQLGWV